MSKEEVKYKPLPGLEGLYSIGNDGTILKHKGQSLLSAQNYYTSRQKGLTKSSLQITLTVNHKHYFYPIAQTVAKLFVPNPDPKRKKYVDYKDGNRDNCRADNLIWVEHKSFTQNPKQKIGIKFHIKKDGHSQLRYS